ncbi:MAG TPA: 16S rRNA (cytosine(967)-C(5))-methyltransferase RsmB, partial [Pyrinomonadaceae bacterium]|nr:16S rRNA (cytosine(967)-C(5))-methyltransferase RsmB [Pyrinomonadaceae bacterium]
KQMAISVARRSAFDILRRVETESAYASVLLATLDTDMRHDDRALCRELVLGVLRRKLWLDRAIEHLADRKFEKLDLSVRLALELGLYQLRFLTRVPSSAAVNESVTLVRASREQSAAGFVNAVLRRATREPNYEPATDISDPIEKLSVETSHPRWLLERWIDAFGFDEAAAFARANNETPPTAFRLTSLAQTESAIDELRAAGAELIPSKISPDGWRANGAGAVLHDLALSGMIYLQDEASQLLPHALQPQAGDRVLDVTAAPGSKATHIAKIAPGAEVIAGDIHSHRAKTMRQLAAKQGARIHVIIHDAVKALPFPKYSFDRVLLDAPCSGTGTLRRNPEIRYRLKADDIVQLSAQQTRMLENASLALRPGARLIYSTCSVEPEENECVINAFLAKYPDFARVQPSAPGSLITSEGFARTWPHRDGCDGFFFATLERLR